MLQELSLNLNDNPKDKEPLDRTRKISLTAMAVDSVFDKQTIPITEELEVSSVKIETEIQQSPAVYIQNDTRTRLTDILRELLSLEAAEILPDKPFMEYGMDSILGVEFIKQINLKFKTTLTP